VPVVFYCRLRRRHALPSSHRLPRPMERGDRDGRTARCREHRFDQDGGSSSSSTSTSTGENMAAGGRQTETTPYIDELVDRPTGECRAVRRRPHCTQRRQYIPFCVQIFVSMAAIVVPCFLLETPRVPYRGRSVFYSKAVDVQPRDTRYRAGTPRASP